METCSNTSVSGKLSKLKLKKPPHATRTKLKNIASSAPPPALVEAEFVVTQGEVAVVLAPRKEGAVVVALPPEHTAPGKDDATPTRRSSHAIVIKVQQPPLQMERLMQ
jgi:hypothetical protein